MRGVGVGGVGVGVGGVGGGGGGEGGVVRRGVAWYSSIENMG